MILTELISKLLPWITKTKLIAIILFVVVLGGLFHACKGPNLNFDWLPWRKSEFQNTKVLVDKTLAEVKKNDKAVEDIQKKIDESKNVTKKIDAKKANLQRKSTTISKAVSDAKNNINTLDSLANGVF